MTSEISSDQVVVRLEGVRKDYGQSIALDDVSLVVPGQVHS
ncbi:hypothetical protein [Streptomyces sp. NPDC002671]